MNSITKASKRFLNDVTGKSYFELEDTPPSSINAIADFYRSPFYNQSPKSNVAAEMEELWRTNPDAQSFLDLVASFIFKGSWEIEVNTEVVKSSKTIESINGFFSRNRKLLTEDYVYWNLATGGFMLDIKGNGADIYRSVLNVIPPKRIKNGYFLNGIPTYADIEVPEEGIQESNENKVKSLYQQIITYGPAPRDPVWDLEDVLLPKKQKLYNVPGDTFTGNVFYTRYNNIPSDFFGRAVYQGFRDRLLGYTEMADSLALADRASRSILLVYKTTVQDQKAIKSRLDDLVSHAKDKSFFRVTYMESEGELSSTPIDMRKVQTRLNLDKSLETLAQTSGFPLILFSRTDTTNRATAEEAVRNIEPRMRTSQTHLTTQLELFFDYIISLDLGKPVRGAVKVVTQPILVESQETVSNNRNRQLETLNKEIETLNTLLTLEKIDQKQFDDKVQELIEIAYPSMVKTDEST